MNALGIYLDSGHVEDDRNYGFYTLTRLAKKFFKFSATSARIPKIVLCRLTKPLRVSVAT